MAGEIITVSDLVLTALAKRGEHVLKQMFVSGAALANLSTEFSQAFRALCKERPDDPTVAKVKETADKLIMGIKQQGSILQEAAGQAAAWRPEWQVEM